MMKQIFALSLVLVFGLIFAACQNNSGETTTPSAETNQTDQAMDSSTMTDGMEQSSDASTNVISLEELAQHVTADDCWMAIEGEVYDVTPFIETQTHPGGAAILEGCGQDATEIFNNRPKDGEPHSEQARSLLPQYLIGSLAN